MIKNCNANVYPVVENGNISIYQIAREGKDCLSHLVSQKKECFIVDPSVFVEEYVDLALGLGLKIKGVFETHTHSDHISGAKQVASITNSELYTPNENRSFTKLNDGDEIKICNMRLKVISTPGHTKDSVSILIPDIAVLSGDLFGGVVDTNGNIDTGLDTQYKIFNKTAEELYESMKKIRNLNKNILVLHSHYKAESYPITTTVDDITNNKIFTSRNELMNLVMSNVKKLSDKQKNISEINKNFVTIPRENAMELEL